MFLRNYIFVFYWKEKWNLRGAAVITKKFAHLRELSNVNRLKQNSISRYMLSEDLMKIGAASKK